MNIFMAAVYTNNYMPGQRLYNDLNERERQVTDTLPHILESYHYVGKQKFVDEMRNNKAQVFLDSGAFSAFTLKIKLTVEEYCDYITRNRDIVRTEDGVLMASVLDAIGGQNPPQQTYENQCEMERRGCRPLPCFHAGEDERYLEHYVANYPYITLGGMVGSSTKQLCTWLDRMWTKYLADPGTGRARLKVHGFGITSIPIMERYPWHSCDSSSWVQSTAFGVIVHPKHGPLNVSEKSPSRHDANAHLSTLPKLQQDYLFEQLQANGFTYERLSTIYQSRAAYNLWAYGEINKMIDAAHDNTYRARVQELF